MQKDGKSNFFFQIRKMKLQDTESFLRVNLDI